MSPHAGAVSGLLLELLELLLLLLLGRIPLKVLGFFLSRSMPKVPSAALVTITSLLAVDADCAALLALGANSPVVANGASLARLAIPPLTAVHADRSPTTFLALAASSNVLANPAASAGFALGAFTPVLANRAATTRSAPIASSSMLTNGTSATGFALTPPPAMVAQSLCIGLCFFGLC